MDIATIIGLILGIGLVLASIMMGGSGGIVPFINIPSMMITIGGSCAALLINFPLGACLGVANVVKKCFTQKLPSPTEVMEQFKEFSAISRKDGLLALESKVEEINDEFLSRGLSLVVGGSTKEELEFQLPTCDQFEFANRSFSDARYYFGDEIDDLLSNFFGVDGSVYDLFLQEIIYH